MPVKVVRLPQGKAVIRRGTNEHKIYTILCRHANRYKWFKVQAIRKMAKIPPRAMAPAVHYLSEIGAISTATNSHPSAMTVHEIKYGPVRPQIV